MKIDFDVIEKIIDKYGSKKALVVVFGMYLVANIQIPETHLWLKGAQIAGITILGIVGVWCQFKLDKEKNENEIERKENV